MRPTGYEMPERTIFHHPLPFQLGISDWAAGILHHNIVQDVGDVSMDQRVVGSDHLVPGRDAKFIYLLEADDERR